MTAALDFNCHQHSAVGDDEVNLPPTIPPVMHVADSTRRGVDKMAPDCGLDQAATKIGIGCQVCGPRITDGRQEGGVEDLKLGA